VGCSRLEDETSWSDNDAVAVADSWDVVPATKYRGRSRGRFDPVQALASRCRPRRRLGESCGTRH